MVLTLLAGSLFVGGVPYIVFLVGILIWTYGKSTLQVRRMTNVAPFLFLVVFAGFAAIVEIARLSQNRAGLIPISLSADLYFIAYLYGLVLLLGYSYVLLMNLGFYLFRKLFSLRRHIYK